MLREALEYLLTPCPRHLRALGFLGEQIAIDARLARNRHAWAPHHEASHKAVLEAAGPGGASILLLGAGLHHDLPLADLAGRFEHLHLADLIHRRRHRRRASALCADRASFHPFDVTGILETLHARGPSLSCEALGSLLSDSLPGLPKSLGAEPDLVVSANLASQLLLLPLEWIGKTREIPEAEARQLQACATRAHLAWLRARSGRCLLITESERRRLSVDGDLVGVETTPGLEGLPAPFSSWTWRLAPIPEASRHHHLEHVMGAWIL